MLNSKLHNKTWSCKTFTEKKSIQESKLVSLALQNPHIIQYYIFVSIVAHLHKCTSAYLCTIQVQIYQCQLLHIWDALGHSGGLGCGTAFICVRWNSIQYIFVFSITLHCDVKSYIAVGSGQAWWGWQMSRGGSTAPVAPPCKIPWGLKYR